MNIAFLKDRITATQAEIIAYEAASLALASGVQSYTIDTGQTRTTVTKLEVRSLQKTLDQLYNRCATLEARLNGSTVHARPGW